MTVDLSRREMLQGSLAIGAGFWLGSARADERQSANDKLNIGIIGAGGKGRANIAGIGSENIVALCDVDEQRAAQALQQFPKAARYHDFRQLLDRQKNLDAVVVSTPDHTHAAATLMAMKLGKHVYCEKPLTHGLHEARQVTLAAAEAKVATQMGNQHHSGDNYRGVVELIQAGAIGTVREAHAWSNRPIWPQGVDRPKERQPVPKTLSWDLWLGPAPQRPYHSSYLPFNWRGWWDFGTGALGDMGCHIIDPVYWALNLDAPTSVTADAEGQTSESGPRRSTIRYEFPARGDRPAVSLTWYDGGNQPPASVVGDRKLPDNGSLFVGEKGMLLAPHGRQSYQLLPEDTYRDYPLPKKTATPKMHYTDWIAACKTGSPTGSHFGYAGPLTETVLLGNLAVRLGKRIEWDSKNLKVVGCPEAEPLIRREYRAGWTL